MQQSNPTPVVKMHLSLNVAHVERSITFYEAFFGVSAHKRRPGYANFDVASPPLKLALEETPTTRSGGALNHLGIQVGTREQVQGARDRLVAAGLATFDERDVTCCYALQDKVWVTDPDGNRWEVYVLLDDMADDEENGDESHHAVEPCCTPTAQPINFTTR